ncbi:DNA-3-methyladenine glycosylase I [Pseudomonadota bacterium]
MLPHAKSARSLAEIPDHRYLSEMAKCIFRSGFVWRVVENKWDNFERVFHDFDPASCASMSDEELETLMRDTSIIRYFKKIKSVRDNAQFILDIADEHDRFAKFISKWPEDNIVELFGMLKKRGSRLGGHTGQYFLRYMGKDTFIFSKDVTAVLISQGIVDKEPSNQKELQATQQAFNQWKNESGRPLCQISRILAMSVA